MSRRVPFTPLSLLLAVASVAVLAPALSTAELAGPRPHDPAAVERLTAAAGGEAEVRIDPATGAVRSVRLPGAPAGLRAQSAGSTAGSAAAGGRAGLAAARDKSMAFLNRHAGAFGLDDPAVQLQAAGETADAQGGAHLSFQQVYRGVPVFGAVLKTHLDPAGELRAVNGTLVPDLALDPHPSLSTARAAEVAIADVETRPTAGESFAPGTGAAGPLAAVSSRLLVFRTGLLQGVPGENHLAWEVEIGDGLAVRELVYVDAHTGKVLDRISGIHHGLSRRAYDGLNLPFVPPSYPASPFWVEGDPFPTGVGEADNMLLASHETYDFFLKAFGRDSIDGAGGIMDQIFNRGFSCPNASWNGTFISFCPGLTSDDVTAHEWAHAYTQYTHGLIYQWQPGALNESYSDIWGETIDRINGRGLDVDGPRTEGLCSAFQTFPRIVRVNSPAAIAGDYAAGTASFGPPVDATGVTGDVVAAVPNIACTAITNPEAVAGKIAFVDRGACNFTVKVKNAQLAGAVAVIVADNLAGGVAGMTGVDPTITIPSLRVTLATGNLIRAQLAGGVNTTLKSAQPPQVDDSARWMLGEDAFGLTGPLRDMWHPPCLGDPGKVSDPEYTCSAGDNGGVHTNSGVPNHAYTLLVDGGTYNGQTIAALGLTKAAHIYFRAMDAYQTLTSDFADHAWALDQACASLVGVDLTDLQTGAPSGQAITAADCAEVANAMAAVEMTQPPVKCNFQPILNPAAPDRCPAGTTEVRVFAQGFEGGPADWAVSHEGSTPFFTPRDWTWVDALPNRRPGAAFFGPNPPIGLCNATSNESGVLHLDGPSIALPSGALQARLTFDHWVSTEPNFDGGNLKVSVNGGAWLLVTPGQFTFNPYNRTLATAAQNNSDPLAGQPAFSGVNQGDVDGSWGRSHVDLSSVAHPGDSVRLRFDLGSDCGGGSFGWYLDDTVLYQCVSAAAPAVSISDASVAEGNDGFRTMTFTISLSAPTTRTVRVRYKTDQGAEASGTASNGTDYLPANGELTFPGLSLGIQQTVSVRIKGDRKNEGDETFFIYLGRPENATLGDGQGQGTILNDD